MKHMHHQQVLLPPSHLQRTGASPPPQQLHPHHHQQQQPVVVVASPPVVTTKRGSGGRGGIELNFFGLIGLFCVFLFVLYVLAMAFAPHFLLGEEGEDAIGPDGHVVHLRHSHRHGASSSRAAPLADEGSCVSLLEQERRAKAQLLEQLKQAESELTEEKRKLRELERDYRDLSLSARAQQQQRGGSNAQTQGGEGDVSALQRLSKCRQAVEESTQTMKELRDHNKGLDAQVTRLQKELREAVADADEQERVAAECERRLKKLTSGSKMPPPPPPASD